LQDGRDETNARRLDGEQVRKLELPVVTALRLAWKYAQESDWQKTKVRAGVLIWIWPRLIEE
jgi:hypothetical protein